MTESFDDIRPFRDDEINAAMKRISHHPMFPQLTRFIYPDLSIEAAVHQLEAIQTVHELQTSFMIEAIRRIIESFSDGFTSSGLHNLRRGKSYLFVSNHRDITLDAFLLQYLLLRDRGDSSYIVFGENLLSSGNVTDMFRSNKLISMSRGGSPRAFYESLRHLSTYINHLIVEEHQSVWIAQKNGRAKDGIDITAPAIIKMLALGGGGDPLQTLSDLHIVPMAISYEWEPCDLLKVNELYQSSHGTYVKAEGEDLNSIVTGIIAPKGKIHLSLARPLTVAELCPPPNTDLFEHVAALIDRRIRRAYRLMPTNYLAADLLAGTHRYHQHYNAALHHHFTQRMNQLPEPAQRDLFLRLYANPVYSAAGSSPVLATKTTT